MTELVRNRRMKIGPLVAAGLVLGVGLGGFFDGILLHQILQWHNMLSSVVPPTNLVAMKYNMIWDGLFHAAVWTACCLGIGLLFRAGRRSDAVWSGRLFAGSLLGGWGLFNAVEGTIDHFVLGLHHVHPGEGQLAWDVGFVAIAGAGFMLLGYALARSARARRPKLVSVPVPAGRPAFVGPRIATITES
ncbi:MAG TPA: DUF2243 domain-containing protein [Kofleriaceae bacterium]|nr:DUF2243 domain-containing protein [Kofleriaceae bacterium]